MKSKSEIILTYLYTLQLLKVPQKRRTCLPVADLLPYQYQDRGLIAQRTCSCSWRHCVEMSPLAMRAWCHAIPCCAKRSEGFDFDVFFKNKQRWQAFYFTEWPPCCGWDLSWILGASLQKYTCSWGPNSHLCIYTHWQPHIHLHVCEWPAKSVQQVSGNQTVYTRRVFTGHDFSFSAV